MIICKVEGGLGNQMFQYATARALSIKTDAPIKLDLTWFDQYQLHNGYELNKFDIKAEIANNDEIEYLIGRQSRLLKAINKRLGISNNRYVLEPDYTFYNKINSIKPPVYLQGYWQSFKYFDNYINTIRKDLTPIIKFSQQSHYVAEEIAQKESVSIHIRRGDYISNKKINAVHGVVSLEYYFDSVKFLLDKLKAPHFYIFSDDPVWVKENFNLDFPSTYINHNFDEKSYEDMQLMSLCKHNVIANSSFSWWGAWLNQNVEKIVIAPANWFKSGKSTSDLFPPTWKII
jgi:hypothetical protein